MYRVLARRAVRVLTVSQFSADELGRVLHVEPARVSVVPNGSDHVDRVVAARPDLAAYPGIAPEAAWVLCVGTFARHKNLGPALDALEAADIPSVVVGARGSAAVFAEAHAGQWSRAIVAGRLSDQELVWLYGHATALVFPSLYEGFGIPVVEAQRLGCPVVALDTGPMREVGGDAVMLCDPRQPQQVVEAVRRLVGEPGLRAQAVEAGRHNAERFRWDLAASRLEDALAQAGWAW
jgi:glycosyltransferase involved in cell wall biosynthesis